MSKNTRNRILLTAVAALLLVAVTVGGTMAWLTAKTTEVTNTFETTSINIKLKEHDLVETDGVYSLDTSNEVDKNTDYLLLPGLTMPKDPFVEVTEGNVYVFVEVVASTAPSADYYLDWKINSNWGSLQEADGTGVTGPHNGKVYGYSTTKDHNLTAVTSEAGKLYILEGNDDFTNGYVSIPGTITSADIAALTVDGTYTSPSLTFYAYAVQATSNPENFDETVWTQYLRDKIAD